MSKDKKLFEILKQAKKINLIFYNLEPNAVKVKRRKV